MTDYKLPPLLEKAYLDKKIKDINGEECDFHSGINREEAERLIQVIRENKAVKTLEIGLAMGASAVCFCETASGIKKDSLHYAIDPYQFADWKGTGVRLIDDSGLKDNFKLLEGKTHEVFHYFLDSGIKLDMAFIDGWHTFDYTFIDFFFVDQVLKDGGILAFHDMYAFSKQKVLRFIKTHRDYEILYNYRITEKDRWKTFKFFVWRILKKPLLIFSWYHWKFQFFSPYGIIFLRKKSSFEPNFDFYKKF
jgi:predicted O-methyltransferase YrrM